MVRIGDFDFFLASNRERTEWILREHRALISAMLDRVQAGERWAYDQIRLTDHYNVGLSLGPDSAGYVLSWTGPYESVGSAHFDRERRLRRD